MKSYTFPCICNIGQVSYDIWKHAGFCVFMWGCWMGSSWIFFDRNSYNPPIIGAGKRGCLYSRKVFFLTSTLLDCSEWYIGQVILLTSWLLQWKVYCEWSSVTLFFFLFAKFRPFVINTFSLTSIYFLWLLKRSLVAEVYYRRLIHYWTLKERLWEKTVLGEFFAHYMIEYLCIRLLFVWLTFLFLYCYSTLQIFETHPQS